MTLPPRAAATAPRVLAAALALCVAAVAAGCGIGATSSGPAVTFPPEPAGPSTPVTAAVTQTRQAIASALAPFSLQLDDADRPFRPSESRLTAAAPRAVYQVVLPQELDGGYIVVYEFPDAARAVDAGNDLAGYLGSGAGRVNFPIDARHTIRQLGTTLIVYTWAPSTSPDPGSPRIADALSTLGIGFAPPR
ncbi:MAG TPA: hypothetical protein VFO05_11730 [Candidatus Limnocylindrales bacterium]|nr:hypothetical protein [Candidatus Limnocylindrales bacterium]